MSISNHSDLPGNRPKHQQGIATIIFVLFLGLALSATSAGVIHTIRSTQEKNVAVNAITHAQTSVWAATEAFRLYLAAADESTIDDLTGDVVIDMDDTYGSITARDIDTSSLGGGVYQVTANIVNKHSVARSSAALNVIFNVTIANPPLPPFVLPGVNFDSNLNVGGDIELFDGTTAMDLAVKGDINISGISINPLNNISATGSVNITNSSVDVESIFANEDVTLANTVVASVSTLGNFLSSGQTHVGKLQANGNADIKSNGRFDVIEVMGDIDIDGWSSEGYGSVKGNGNVLLDAGAFTDTIQAIGNVRVNVSGPINTITSEGNIRCVGPWWNNVTSISANGTLTNCPPGSPTTATEEFASNIIDPVLPLVPYVHTENFINVWVLEDLSNYVVRYDAATQKIKVTVRAIEGIANGTEYFVGKYSNNYNDYLCETISPTGNCLTPTEPLVPLCLGESLYNGCISYDVAQNRFDVIPNNTAPGIMWFDGNLKLGNGVSVTTFLATENIETSGQFVTYAANAAAYDKVCLANADHIKNSLRDRFTDGYSTHYPTNLCDIANAQYEPTSVGNVALAAGGVDPNGDGSYSGGNINLGASTVITGSVLAGNVLSTTGNVTINGAVAASADADNTADNTFGSSTKIDISTGTSTFNPLEVPDTSGTASLTPNSSSNSNPNETIIVWSRYL